MKVIKSSTKRSLQAQVLVFCTTGVLAVGTVFGQTATETEIKNNSPEQITSHYKQTFSKRLARGSQLLTKISQVGNSMLFSDGEAILKAFGFQQFETRIFPTYAIVQPIKTAPTNKENPEFDKSGLTEIAVNPWISDPRLDFSARFGGKFDLETVCVSLDDVRKEFGPAAKQTVSEILETDPLPRPTPLNNVGHITIKPVPVVGGGMGSAIFTFGYQECADSFSYAFIKN